MDTYEYIVRSFGTDGSKETMEKTTNELKEYGASGWELVSVVPLEDVRGASSLFYFKRDASVP